MIPDLVQEEEVRVSNEAWEVKLAFTKMTPKRGSSGGGTTARGDTSGSDSNSKKTFPPSLNFLLFDFV